MTAAIQALPHRTYNTFDMRRVVFNPDTSLSPVAKLLLNCLDFHADAQGRCWPSVALLSKETGHHRATIHKALNTRHEAGWTTRFNQYTKGRQTVNASQLHTTPVNRHTPTLVTEQVDRVSPEATQTTHPILCETEEEDRVVCSPEKSSSGKPS